MAKKTDFKDIKIVFMDVDGVLTDGKVMFINGKSPKTWHVRDRLAIKILTSLKEEDISVIWISGRHAPELKERGDELGVAEVFSDIEAKVPVMEKILNKYNLVKEDALYIGDDLVDIGCIKKAGLGCCPADAAEEVKEEADFICRKSGGVGAVREIIENILKGKGYWDGIVDRFQKG
jgi:3-deoxy-D-manno-octulosonate 8-phosphate phosphatase (KDO 8-P phosphatase)